MRCLWDSKRKQGCPRAVGRQALGYFTSYPSWVLLKTELGTSRKKGIFKLLSCREWMEYKAFLGETLRFLADGSEVVSQGCSIVYILELYCWLFNLLLLLSVKGIKIFPLLS